MKQLVAILGKGEIKKALSALRNLSHLIHITGTVGSYS